MRHSFLNRSDTFFFSIFTSAKIPAEFPTAGVFPGERVLGEKAAHVATECAHLTRQLLHAPAQLLHVAGGGAHSAGASQSVAGGGAHSAGGS